MTDSGYSPYASTTLNFGEAFQLRTTTRGQDYTGTRVNASRPVTVYGGHQCGFVPSADTDRCGHMESEVPPLESWGSEFIIPQVPGRGGLNAGYTIRVIASADDTTVSVEYQGYVDGDVIQTGQFFEHEVPSSEVSAYVTCTANCMTVIYNKGDKYDNQSSNPFMLRILATTQHSADYRFAVPVPEKEPSTWVTVVVLTDDKEGFSLNGRSLDNEAWEEVQGTQYSVVAVQLTTEPTQSLNGANTLTHADSNVVYAAYLIGQLSAPYAEGYAFPLGTNLGDG